MTGWTPRTEPDVDGLPTAAGRQSRTAAEAIAAGNSGANASTNSPARVTEALTVNASDRTDARASFSDYGSALDLFAPDVSITSDWRTSNTPTPELPLGPAR